MKESRWLVKSDQTQQVPPLETELRRQQRKWPPSTGTDDSQRWYHEAIYSSWQNDNLCCCVTCVRVMKSEWCKRASIKAREWTWRWSTGDSVVSDFLHTLLLRLVQRQTSPIWSICESHIPQRSIDTGKDSHGGGADNQRVASRSCTQCTRQHKRTSAPITLILEGKNKPSPGFSNTIAGGGVVMVKTMIAVPRETRNPSDIDIKDRKSERILMPLSRRDHFGGRSWKALLARSEMSKAYPKRSLQPYIMRKSAFKLDAGHLRGARKMHENFKTRQKRVCRRAIANERGTRGTKTVTITAHFKRKIRLPWLPEKEAVIRRMTMTTLAYKPQRGKTLQASKKQRSPLPITHRIPPGRQKKKKSLKRSRLQDHLQEGVLPVP